MKGNNNNSYVYAVQFFFIQTHREKEVQRVQTGQWNKIINNNSVDLVLIEAKFLSIFFFNFENFDFFDKQKKYVKVSYRDENYVIVVVMNHACLFRGDTNDIMTRLTASRNSL